VGEAQDDPNENPVLDTPTAGRGLGDMLSGLSFNFTLCGYIFKKIVLPILGSIIVSALLYYLFFMK
jgi:hypothetical protein